MRRISIAILLILSLALLSAPQNAWGFFLDRENTMRLQGRLSTQFSLRTEDSKGWTLPVTEVGDLVQHRNIMLLEFDHDLRNLRDDVQIFLPFQALKLDLKYHLTYRLAYEGIYDYGPSQFTDLKDAREEFIDNFQLSSEIWEAYLDMSRGPVAFRFGRQNLSWGETDAFKILDSIQPLDNTFGAYYDPLDDRRIPLWMVRGDLDLGGYGKVNSLALQAFWVPGYLDNTIAPFAPDGTPYAAPQSPVPFPIIDDYPERDLDASRYGFRLNTMLFNNLNLSLAHFYSYSSWDIPSLRFAAIPAKFKLTEDTKAIAMEFSFPKIAITGASMNFYESHLDVVFRSEVAMFWDEPIFIVEENMALSDSYTQADWFDNLVEALGLDLPWPGIPNGIKGGTIPKRDVLRWMIGFDKFVWIRPLNKTSMFFFTGQWFAQYMFDWDESIRQPLPDAPDKLPCDSIEQLNLGFKFIDQKETEHQFTLVMNTMYWHGKIIPEVAMIYDARGTWFVQPTVTVALGSFRITAQYNFVDGAMSQLGAFHDRDQATLKLTYLIN